MTGAKQKTQQAVRNHHKTVLLPELSSAADHPEVQMLPAKAGSPCQLADEADFV